MAKKRTKGPKICWVPTKERRRAIDSLIAELDTLVVLLDPLGTPNGVVFTWDQLEEFLSDLKESSSRVWEGVKQIRKEAKKLRERLSNTVKK